MKTQNFSKLFFFLSLIFPFLFYLKPLSLEKVKLKITLNPFKTAPLSAQVTLKIAYPPDDLKVKATVLGKPAGGINITHIFDLKNLKKEKKGVVFPLLGLYPNYKNQVELQLIQNKKVLLTFNRTITTPQLKKKLVVPLEIFKNKLKKNDQKTYLVDNIKIAFDQKGEIRWAYEGDSFLNYGKLKNGALLIMSGENIRFRYHYKKFYEVSMLGEIIRTYDLEKYYGHHDVWEIQTYPYQGDFLVAANEAAPSLLSNAGNDGINEEDYIFLMDRFTGEIKKKWDLKKVFDQKNPNKHRLPRTSQVHMDDWIHFNSLYHDQQDNSIVFSSRHQSAVVKYDFNSGKLIWIIADNSKQQWNKEKNFYGQTIADYVLTPVDSNGKIILDTGKINFWPYGQHAAKNIKGNPSHQENIILFDNGNYRNYFQYGPTKNRKKSPRYSRAVEYLIDRKKFTIKKIWDFDYQRKIYTIATGSVDILANNHRLIGFMWTTKNKKTPLIVELDQQDNIVFEARVNQGKTFYYQVEKFDLYQGF